MVARNGIKQICCSKPKQIIEIPVTTTKRNNKVCEFEASPPKKSIVRNCMKINEMKSVHVQLDLDNDSLAKVQQARVGRRCSKHKLLWQ